jgi:hypothetical protein
MKVLDRKEASDKPYEAITNISYYETIKLVTKTPKEIDTILS